MPVDISLLPSRPCLLRLRAGGSSVTALAQDGRIYQLAEGLDRLLARPLSEIRPALTRPGRELAPDDCELLAPAEGQEIWGAGVTYVRSREARMEESQEADVYAKVYTADRPELFFKAAGWRVVPAGGEVGIRSDSSWNVPEPELCVLSNSHGEVVAYACGNDMSSRSIEGENPLYLPQAKVYDRSCAVGPAAVLAWEFEAASAKMRLEIERDGQLAFVGEAALSDLVRDPVELTAVLHSAYSLPVGAWLMTGTAIVPPLPYTALPGDKVTIAIDGLGRLVNRLVSVPCSPAKALPQIGGAAR